MTFMTGMLIALWLQAPPALATPPPPPRVQSQQRPAVEAPQRAAAYYQFLLARALEDEDKGEEAVKALEQAVALDPASAELRAELASMFLRLGRGDEARAAAEGALKVDGRNAEAHWVLGTMLATRALRPDASQPPNQEDLAAAAGHFEQALWDRRFDLGMQVTLGRLYLAKGDAQKAVDILRSVVARRSTPCASCSRSSRASSAHGRRWPSSTSGRAASMKPPRRMRRRRSRTPVRAS
jgi:tetratricopeptide (TPR) repeat protein